MEPHLTAMECHSTYWITRVMCTIWLVSLMLFCQIKPCTALPCWCIIGSTTAIYMES